MYFFLALFKDHLKWKTVILTHLDQNLDPAVAEKIDKMQSLMK